MTAQELLQYLKNIDQYYALIPQSENRAAHFEQLISKSISEIFKMKYFCLENDNKTIPYRLVWYGSDHHPIHPAQIEGKPDAIARCHNFFLIIEATLKTEGKQWNQEFGSSVSHLDNFISEEGCNKNQTYILLITKEISNYTYNSVKNHPRMDCKFIPLELSILAQILETSISAFTLKHFEIRQLLMEIPKLIENSTDLNDFREQLKNQIIYWKRDIFGKESNTIIGLKSYEAMKQTKRTFVGESEILQMLENSEEITQYLKIIGKQINARMIEDSLICQSLIANKTTNIEDGETMYQPVPYIEYKDRACRIIKNIKRIN
jgi:hypothetical protein